MAPANATLAPAAMNRVRRPAVHWMKASATNDPR